MKKKKVFLKILAVVLVLNLMITTLPSFSVFAEETRSEEKLTEKGELWLPQINSNAHNTKGDLSIEDLQTAKLLAKDTPEIVSKEIIEKNGHVNRLWDQEEDLNTIVFQNRDGTKTMYYYSDAVKYVDSNGIIRDKSNVLTDNISQSRFKTDYAYVNSANDIQTYFPKVLNEDTGVVLEGYDVNIDFAPISFGSRDSEARGLSLSAKSTSARTGSIQTEQKTDQDVVLYPGVFGDNTTLRFTPTFEGFKEDILLDCYDGNNEFTYRVKTNGLTLFSEDGLCYFIDPLTGETKAMIDKIVVFDSKENKQVITDTLKAMETTKTAERKTSLSVTKSESVQSEAEKDVVPSYNHYYCVETIKPDEEYLITLVVDEKYLKSEETVYPVTVDPSTTVIATGSGTSKTIMDAPIYSGRPTKAHGGNRYSVIGYVPSYDGTYFGVGRNLIKFPGLINNSIFQNINDSDIYSVNVYMRATGGGSSSTWVDAYIFYGSNWTENTVTCQSSNWDNYTCFLDCSYISGATWTYFDITDAAKSWKSGTYNANTGIILKNENESNANYQWNFATTEYNGSSSFKPFVTVNYYHDTTASTGITNGGTYYIKNNTSKKYMEHSKSNGVIQNPKSTVIADIPYQRWRINRWGQGMYWLQPMDGYNRDDNEYPYALTSNSSGALYITQKTANVNVNQLFILTRNSDGTYYIRPAITGTDRSLTVEGVGSGTAVTTAEHSSSIPCMKWRFEEVNNFNVSINNYYDYGFVTRFTSSTNATINNRQTKVNDFLSSVFNITVANNNPVRHKSYADMCYDGYSINQTLIDEGCNHLAPSCDGENELCHHILSGIGSCSSSCSSPYHHNNSLKIHSWFTHEFNNPDADINLLWIGHSACEEMYVPLSLGTHITATMYDPLDSRYADYTAFHEIGHSLGARGDEECKSTSCVMSYATSWDTYFSLLENPGENTFCAQCKNEIRENLLQHY